MDKIRFGLIGGGEGSFIGPVHVRSALMDGCFELVCGAFSSDARRSVKAGKTYHVDPSRAYKSWQDMFDREKNLPPDQRMQAVVIATPNHLHFAQAKAALVAGFHVICDKPVTTSSQQAEELENLVEQSGLLFALTHTYSGYPMVKEVRQMVASGKLGAIRKLVVEYPQGWLSRPLETQGNKQAGWRLDPAQSGPGGCLGDIGVHAHHLAEYVLNDKVEWVSAHINTVVPGRTLDDDVVALLKFSGGCNGLLFASQVFLERTTI